MRRSQSPTALEHLARCHEIVGHHTRACELRARAAWLRSMGAEQLTLTRVEVTSSQPFTVTGLPSMWEVSRG